MDFAEKQKNIFAFPLRKDTRTPIAIIKDYVRAETTIISDDWKAYDNLSKEGFHHLLLTTRASLLIPKLVPIPVTSRQSGGTQKEQPLR